MRHSVHDGMAWTISFCTIKFALFACFSCFSSGSFVHLVCFVDFTHSWRLQMCARFFFGTLSFWNRMNRRQRNTLQLLCLRNGKRRANAEYENSRKMHRISAFVHTDIEYPKLNENHENIYIECEKRCRACYMHIESEKVEWKEEESWCRSCISEMPFRAKSGRLNIWYWFGRFHWQEWRCGFVVVFWFYHQNKWLPFHSLPLTILAHAHTKRQMTMTIPYTRSIEYVRVAWVFLNKNDNIDDDDDTKKKCAVNEIERKE